jgi:hypothetical protein
MVYFECTICIRTLKKKQAERHNFECRSSCNFTCLTCWKVFDLETIKAHTSCVTEEEKYQKGDSKKPTMKNPNNNNKLEIKSLDLNSLKWTGFRKTCKRILKGFENYKLSLNDLIVKITHVYAKDKNADLDHVDQGLVKKHLLQKIEKDNRFVIDLSKNTVRFKSQ